MVIIVGLQSTQHTLYLECSPMKKDELTGNMLYTPDVKPSMLMNFGNKFEFEGYTFNEEIWGKNPIMLLMLILVTDPTPQQQIMLNLMNVVVEDDNGKKFWPREMPKKQHWTAKSDCEFIPNKEQK